MCYPESAQLFAKVGIVARAPRQRRNKDLLPTFLFADLTPCQFSQYPLPNNLPVKLELVGTFTPSHGYSAGRLVHIYVVHLQSGLKVPAYSLGVGYNICQHTEFMAVQG